MTLSVQQISDRCEIQDLLIDDARAIDSKNWAALDDVFSTDAWIDYSAMGGAKGNLAEIKEFLAAAMPMFPSTQHLIANMPNMALAAGMPAEVFIVTGERTFADYLITPIKLSFARAFPVTKGLHARSTNQIALLSTEISNDQGSISGARRRGYTGYARCLARLLAVVG